MTIEETKCGCMFCSGLASWAIRDYSTDRYGATRQPSEEEKDKFWKQHDIQKAQREIELGLVPNPS